MLSVSYQNIFLFSSIPCTMSLLNNEVLYSFSRFYFPSLLPTLFIFYFFCSIYLAHPCCCWHTHRLSHICSSRHVLMKLISFCHSQCKDSYLPASAFFFCTHFEIQSSSSLHTKISYKNVAKSIKKNKSTNLRELTFWQVLYHLRVLSCALLPLAFFSEQ